MTNKEVYEILKEISDYCKGRNRCNGCDFKIEETGHCMIKGRPDMWEVEVREGDTDESNH